MSLPDLSYMMNVGQLRYIQARFETSQYRNPDSLVGEFLSFRQRLSCFLRGRLFRDRLRANPFYSYVLARTLYYDQVFLDAIARSVTCIINIGCGGDTRAYRFADLLVRNGVNVVECDQSEAIHQKQLIARRCWPTKHVRYLPLDLNGSDWTEFLQLVKGLKQAPILVMMEGVSPYIGRASFGEFLHALSRELNPGSLLAYDFKIAGAADDFGRSSLVPQPFRLRAVNHEVAAYHQALGLGLQHMELSTELVQRLLPGIPALFGEDCLLQFNPAKEASL